MAGAITVVTTIWLMSLLLFLLPAALMLSITLISIARRLRREIEEAGFSIDEPKINVRHHSLVRQIRDLLRDFSF